MEQNKELTAEQLEALEKQKLEQSETFTHEFMDVLAEELFTAADYLEELHVLRRYEKLIQKRIKEISDDAIREALDILGAEKPARTNGAFEHYGKQFELSAKPVYDFVGHAQRYTMEDGVNYRKYYLEQKRLKEQSQAKTNKMAAINKSFPVENPDWAPDWTELTIKCL